MHRLRAGLYASSQTAVSSKQQQGATVDDDAGETERLSSPRYTLHRIHGTPRGRRPAARQQRQEESRMVPDRRLGVAFICACSASVALGFLPGVGTGCVGSRQRIEGCTSIIPTNTHQHRSFAGAPVVQGRPTAGLRRGGRNGRNGRRRCDG